MFALMLDFERLAFLIVLAVILGMRLPTSIREGDVTSSIRTPAQGMVNTWPRQDMTSNMGPDSPAWTFQAGERQFGESVNLLVSVEVLDCDNIRERDIRDNVCA